MGEVVDDVRYSPAVFVNCAQCPARESRAAVAAGEGEAVVDLVRHIAEVERAQLAVDEDALAKLAELLAGEHIFQLGLADEHDLEELLFVGFQLGEHPDLLQHLGAEVLRLVNDQPRCRGRA